MPQIAQIHHAQNSPIASSTLSLLLLSPREYGSIITISQAWNLEVITIHLQLSTQLSIAHHVL